MTANNCCHMPFSRLCHGLAKSLFAILLCLQVVHADDSKIGVFYFSGWKANQVGNAYAAPWEPIKPYPERKPLLGWYAEDDPGVMSAQLKWMRNSGIDFVVFDMLWGADSRPYLAHGVNAYLTAEDRHGVEFSVLWANHTTYVFSLAQFEDLFRFWAERYFFRRDYLKVDGKPVVFLFSADTFRKNAENIGMTSESLTAHANKIARDAGLPGVHFVGGIGGNHGNGFDYSGASGFAGFSAYNFHGPATYSYAPGRQVSHSYAELDAGYQDHWNWMLRNASGLYIVPMTSGWDKRPWRGSSDPGHDDSQSTPEGFERHLMAAKWVIEGNRERTRGMGVICCWNEFGEGSYIEPTTMDGFAYLEKIKNVFGNSQ